MPFFLWPLINPGPDGFSPAFFQHFWSEIGDDVARFILGYLNGQNWPTGMNDAHVTLIPKKSTPVYMGDLRPIALCNVTYKILSKMLANRLKEVLNGVISAEQSAFLHGRLITDNVFIASEVIHYLHRKRQGNTGWCALKLDMAKAYDKMEWGFLRQIMLHMGFADQRVGYLLGKAVHNREISPCVVARGAPGVSHLFFADDSLLFFKATSSEAISVKGCLTAYEAMSGQSAVENLGKYLGLPLGIGRNRKEVIAYLETKLRHRLAGWHKKYWWEQGNEGGGIRWMAWQRMCTPKTDGGMGFKQLNEFNLALLAKQEIGSSPSYVWRSILAGKDILSTGCVKRIGNGEDTLNHGMTVSELIDPVTKDWDVQKLATCFEDRDIDLIRKIPVAPVIVIAGTGKMISKASIK
ncbi:PREDICTED: uncharacterized protein LOC109150287 [Ipomoea nil]|uniref:uncharacterized protein LOC109150287 n=1 Tax=Ipomoea nil TaxID=35883 RepID=UPI0009011EBF|nr:PREDICTED: uncharacterized protein LOC109150287 [Ipomoea nil]